VTAAASAGKKQYLVGRSQLYRRDHMQISQPLRHGLVQDWDAVEQIWDYALRQHLRVDARDHPLLLSEPTFQPHADREKMLQMMFERFEAPATFLCKSSVLTAFSAGRSTACVVESGAGHTTVSPIHDGYVISKGVRRSQMAGGKLDEILEKFITQDYGKPIVPSVRISAADRVAGGPSAGASFCAAPADTRNCVRALTRTPSLPCRCRWQSVLPCSAANSTFSTRK